MKWYLLTIIIGGIFMSLVSAGLLDNPFGIETIDAKDYYNNTQRISTTNIDFDVPIIATHYWNPKGLDTYEVIVDMDLKGYGKKTIKLTWDDERYVNENLKIDYNFVNGALSESSIVPYSTASKSKLTFTNKKVEIGEIVDYEVIEEQDFECQKTAIQNNKSFGDCVLYVKKPVYEWKPYEIITAGTKTFKATDDTVVSACGTLSSANTRYYLTGNLSTTGTCITITANNVTFDGQGYWIDGDDSGTTDYGITASARLNITIKNFANITDFYYGIFFTSGTNNSLIQNITVNSNTQVGISLSSSSNNNQLTNITANSNAIYGISLSSSSNNTLSNITANSNYAGIALSSSSNNNQLTNITANSNFFSGIRLDSSSNNTLSNITANSNFFSGIRLESSSNNTLSNITANSNSQYGIYLSLSSNNNQLSNITANSNLINGIYLISNSNNNQLSNINVNSNTQTGIYIGSSSNNSLMNLILNSNSNGIYLTSSSNNRINNTNMWNCSNGTSYSCVYIYRASSNYFENLYINLTTNSGKGILLFGNSATASNNVSNNLFKNVLIENVNGQDVNITQTAGNVLNNTFLNVTYNNSDEFVSGSAGTVELFRKWYYDANVNTTCNNKDIVNVWAENSTAVEDNQTVDFNGNARLTLTQYTNLDGTKTYKDNYTIYAKNTTYSDTQNMTTNKQKFFEITSGCCSLSNPLVLLDSCVLTNKIFNVTTTTCQGTTPIKTYLINTTINSTNLYLNNNCSIYGDSNSKLWIRN